MKIELAKSLSGHDKNQIYVILKNEGRFAYLVNGKTHLLTNPKKKNIKHFQSIKKYAWEADTLTDEQIRRIIKEYIGAIDK